MYTFKLNIVIINSFTSAVASINHCSYNKTIEITIKMRNKTTYTFLSGNCLLTIVVKCLSSSYKWMGILFWYKEITLKKTSNWELTIVN